MNELDDRQIADIVEASSNFYQERAWYVVFDFTAPEEEPVGGWDDPVPFRSEAHAIKAMETLARHGGTYKVARMTKLVCYEMLPSYNGETPPAPLPEDAP